ncbi:hypothetical protein QE152_g1284 [Popillia japonica]|uniref:Uncharacterized protein n=1 Tax=Popillia japonica TaxID=7064 RepID=A0AAW1N864_POPJA
MYISAICSLKLSAHTKIIFPDTALENSASCLRFEVTGCKKEHMKGFSKYRFMYFVDSIRDFALQVAKQHRNT